MAVALGKRLLTIEDFERDYFDSRYELIRGELKEMPPNSLLAPDWAFIRTARLPIQPSPKFSQIVPDAVLEVRSPSDRPREVQEKMLPWIEVGVRIAWEYDPATKTMTVYRPGMEAAEIGLNGIVSGEEVIPGFEMSLREMLE